MKIRTLLVGLALMAGGCQPSGETSWQGWIEADLLFIGPDDSGRIAVENVVEGQQVKTDELLFGIDPLTQKADVDAAKASLAQAEARLARLVAAQQRPEEIAVIQASQQQARAALDFSTSELERVRALVSRGNATRQQLDQAQSNYDRDKAAVDNAARQIDVARLAGRTEDIDAARGAVDQARAQLSSAEARLGRTTVAAPTDGRIEEIYYRIGEIAPQGRPVLSLLPPGNMKARFFAPEASLPKLHIGGPVRILCDGCPAGLTGRVSFISRQAEFTPPVIYSLDERRKLVFRIEAQLDKPELFRVGQPVSVVPVEPP